MSAPNIVFIKGQGGLQRPLPGQDFVSAMPFYTATLPSGFTTQNNIKQFLQPSDAIAAGILNDYSDATPATAEYLITADGAVGDSIAINIADIDNEGNAQSTQIAAYTRLSSDTTIALLGASIAAAINAGTLTHGYSAAFVTATLTITAPKRLGIFLNSGSPLSVVIGGEIAGTITQFASGTFSAFAFYYYQILRFFSQQPGGILYVGFFPVPGGAYTFTEITTMQTFATGNLRQIGIYKDFASAWNVNDMTVIDGVCKANDIIHKPLSALYSANLSGTADISTLVDLNIYSANKCSPIIGMDGGSQGWFLWLTSGKSCPCLGAALGTVALSKVSESIGWVGQFNISDGDEFETIAFANGQQYSSSAISDNTINVLDARRYIFLRKFVGLDGSYFNNGNCACSVASDYAYIENNRTIDKSIRGIYTSLLPALNSPIQLNSDGTLSETSTAYFESQGGVNLDQMVRNGELSAFQVTVNPAQNVLSTSTLIVVVQLVINGVARNIQVNIGFTPKIS